MISFSHFYVEYPFPNAIMNNETDIDNFVSECVIFCSLTTLATSKANAGTRRSTLRDSVVACLVTLKTCSQSFHEPMFVAVFYCA